MTIKVQDIFAKNEFAHVDICKDRNDDLSTSDLETLSRKRFSRIIMVIKQNLT